MRLASSVLAVSSLVASAASAQTPTDAAAVVKEKPQETAAAIPAEVKPDWVQEAQGSIGALANTGNVESGALKLGGFYAVRYLQHGVRFDIGSGVVALNSDADGDPSNGFSKIVDGDAVPASPLDNINTNAFGKVRYDYFLGDFGSVYGAGLVFHDSAVNLLARSRADVGYRHYLFNVPKHVLSAEVGGVYTIDNAIFAVENADTNQDGKVSVWGDKTEFESTGGVVGARAALSYSNALLENVTFTQTLEIIPNLSFGSGVPVFGNVAAPFEQTRNNGAGDNELGLGEATIANANSQLTVSLMQNLAISASLTLGYDNGAIARRNAFTNHDVATSVSLSYKFF